jgi:hypothetical protein
VSAAERDLDDLLAATPPGADGDGGRVRVTTHAQLAYLERVNPVEPYPAAQLRARWRRSDAHPYPNARAAGELLLVYDVDESRDRTTILTCHYTHERN